MTVNEFTKPQPLSDTVREFVILTPVFDIRFFIPDFDKERDLVSDTKTEEAKITF